MKKDLLTLRDITRDELETIFDLAAKLKRERGKVEERPLAGKSIGLIFAKSSTRTRVSSVTLPRLLMTRLTVAKETPAAWAT